MTPGRSETNRGRPASRRLGGAVSRLANRLAQAGVAVALLTGVRRRDPSVVVNAVLSLAFAALPRALETGYRVRFRPWHRLWVSVAAFVHTLGMLGPYDRIWWWDHLAHALSGVVVAGATDVVLGATTEPDPEAGRARSRGIVVAAVTLAFGVLWELLEYAVHASADWLGLEPLLVHYGRRDALADLLFDLVGAAIVVLFGRRVLPRREPTGVESP